MYIYIYIYIYIHISKSMHTSMNFYIQVDNWMFLSINKNQNSHTLELLGFESFESRDQFQLPPKHLACWSAKVGDYWASGKAFEADHRWLPWWLAEHVKCILYVSWYLSMCFRFSCIYIYMEYCIICFRLLSITFYWLRGLESNLRNCHQGVQYKSKSYPPGNLHIRL